MLLRGDAWLAHRRLQEEPPPRVSLGIGAWKFRLYGACPLNPASCRDSGSIRRRRKSRALRPSNGAYALLARAQGGGGEGACGAKCPFSPVP